MVMYHGSYKTSHCPNMVTAWKAEPCALFADHCDLTAAEIYYLWKSARDVSGTKTDFF